MKWLIIIVTVVAIWSCAEKADSYILHGEFNREYQKVYCINFKDGNYFGVKFYDNEKTKETHYLHLIFMRDRGQINETTKFHTLDNAIMQFIEGSEIYISEDKQKYFLEILGVNGDEYFFKLSIQEHEIEKIGTVNTQDINFSCINTEESTVTNFFKLW